LPAEPALLLVTTVPITLDVFLTPYARHFHELGWRVDALANGATSIATLADPFDHRYDVHWTRSPLSPANFGTARRVSELVMAERYDIVHVHTPVAAFITRFALRTLPAASRPTVIYTAHGFHFYQGQARLPHLLYRSMERLAAGWTDYLVTLNREDERAARAFTRIPPVRVRRIPGIGVDVDLYAEGAVSAEQIDGVRQELDVPPDAFMLTMIAEFSPVKRHEHLLKALERVRDERVVVVFVGDGPLETHIRKHVEAAGLTGSVRFAGYRSDIAAVLAASDALALVSEREGLPRSILEAMAAGRPIVGTDIRGITDAVGDDAGWIVPRHDVDALARAIEEAAADPVMTARRGHAARARALREFALTRIIGEYEDLYREALASRV
jgi:glycosyltransferase involved in cell wall biosynthesis